jgi:predicted methyltransferase
MTAMNTSSTGAVAEPTQLRRRALIGVLLAAAPLAALGQAPATHHHDFKGAEQWAKAFDDPKRDAWQKPHEVIKALALAPDAVVADIGAGTGYFAVRLAHMLERGRVYGVDTEPDMVAWLTRRAGEAGLANLVAVRAKPDASGLPEPVDLALLVDVYHHIAARVPYFRDLRASLKPGGRVAVIDFRASSKIGPPARDRIPAARVEAEMAEAGYRLTARHGFLPNQFFLVFAPR